MKVRVHIQRRTLTKEGPIIANFSKVINVDNNFFYLSEQEQENIIEAFIPSGSYDYWFEERVD